MVNLFRLCATVKNSQYAFIKFLKYQLMKKIRYLLCEMGLSFSLFVTIYEFKIRKVKELVLLRDVAGNQETVKIGIQNKYILKI